MNNHSLKMELFLFRFLNRYFSLDMRMWIIPLQRKIIVGETEDVFNIGIDVHGG